MSRWLWVPIAVKCLAVVLAIVEIVVAWEFVRRHETGALVEVLLKTAVIITATLEVGLSAYGIG